MIRKLCIVIFLFLIISTTAQNNNLGVFEGDVFEFTVSLHDYNKKFNDYLPDTNEKFNLAILDLVNGGIKPLINLSISHTGGTFENQITAGLSEFVTDLNWDEHRQFIKDTVVGEYETLELIEDDKNFGYESFTNDTFVTSIFNSTYISHEVTIYDKSDGVIVFANWYIDQYLVFNNGTTRAYYDEIIFDRVQKENTSSLEVSIPVLGIISTFVYFKQSRATKN